jgi:hypothetical protein
MILSHGLIWLFVVTVNRSGDFYGELGANNLAIVAGTAHGPVLDLWQGIPFKVEFIAHLKDISRAKLNTKATTLASFLIDTDLARGGSFLSVARGCYLWFHNHTIRQ